MMRDYPLGITIACFLLMLMPFHVAATLNPTRFHQALVNANIVAMIMTPPAAAFVASQAIESSAMAAVSSLPVFTSMAAKFSEQNINRISLIAFLLSILSLVVPHITGHNFSSNVALSIRVGASLSILLPFVIAYIVIAHLADEYVKGQANHKKMQRKMNSVIQLSEELLYDMLPKEIANRVRQGETFVADDYPEATILFAYAKDYGAWSASYPTIEVIHVLNSIFSLWDDIVGRHPVYKVETIGEAYMVSISINITNVIAVTYYFFVGFSWMPG
jgi:hypothetical protein